MAGPNLELFKFSLYLFFPLAVMVHYGSPDWYQSNVLPIRDRYWPEEEVLYKPPRNTADLKTELAELRAHRLTNKERKDQGLPPLPPPPRTSTTSMRPSSPDQHANDAHSFPSLRDGASIGSMWMRETRSSPEPMHKTATWRETWQEARETHVV